jgi:murein DD-endopeptidase MepM/ murein hydrolase activator NlpD
MPPVLLSAARVRPGADAAFRAALAAAALTLTIAASASCVYPPHPVYRPGAPPVRQTGDARGAASAPASAAAREPDDMQYLRSRRLIVPVAGVQPEELRNDFYAARSGGRRHNAIDILAPYGTPVISADDGYVVRLTRNKAGGIVLYATDSEERIVYYYAHLAGYYDGVTAGKAIAKGDTLGYVGTSGNAPEDTPHLHFQITRMRPGGRYWAGTPLNPYPLLKEAGEQKREEPVAAQGVMPQAQPRPTEPAPPPVPPTRR